MSSAEKSKQVELITDGHTVSVRSIDEAIKARADIIDKLLNIVALAANRNTKNREYSGGIK